MLNITSKATTKKVAIKHTKMEIRNEFQYFTTEKLNTKEESKIGNEVQKYYKAYRKHIEKWGKKASAL